MKTKQIIEAIKRWSPYGLCRNIYIKRNGDRRKTEACAMGCLALDFLYSKDGKRFIRENGYESVEYYFSDYYVDDAVLKFVKDYFSLSEDDSNTIVHFNDYCLEKSFRERETYDIPRDLRRVIYRLRKQYDNGMLDEK